MANKTCIICGGRGRKTKFGYCSPDKYERWVGLKDIKRLWVRCERCGFYWQLRNYPLADLEKIYLDGYRDPEFRGETIEQAYDRVRKLKYSENEIRYIWFAMHVKYKQAKYVLDVGSGFGVWPAILNDAEYDVTCVEENEDSLNFLYEELGFPVSGSIHFFTEGEKFDTVTLVHVLEHIEDLHGFLGKVKSMLRKKGYLFVECPDNSEFANHDKNHDEFNSCHLWHFDMASLSTLLKRYGFTPVDAHRVTYEGRGLSRIQMICRS